jgi:anti-anti-sigma regulatory factor
MIVVKDQLFSVKTLAQYDDSTNFVDDDFIKNVVNPKLSPTIKIFKIHGSLYFANCNYLQEKISKLLDFAEPIDDINNNSCKILQMSSLEESKKGFIEYSLLLDFSSVSYIDTNGAKMIMQLIDDYKKKDINVYICEPQGSRF